MDLTREPVSEAKRKIQISQPCTGEEEWLAVKEPLLSGWLTQGPKVAEFEKIFAKRHDARHAIATTSCTTSLHLILAAMGIGPGDEVIVPSFTWVATANIVLYCGATPILADVDRETFNLDPVSVARKLSSKTKAIIAVHLFGLCADVDAIKKVAPGIPIIEDAACAAGSARDGKPAGTLGFAAAFSFHPRKSVTTGEGGMIVTNDDEFAARVDILRNHGASISEEQRHHGPRPYILADFNHLGYNYRMTDLQGAVGIVQLRKLDQFIEERSQWAEFYSRELASVNWIRTPNLGGSVRHGWQSYVTYVDPGLAPMPRNAIMERLEAMGVSTRPGTHSIHMLGYYRERFGFKPDDLPGARDCGHNTMAIPLHNRMSPDDYKYVVKAIKEIR